VIGERFGGLAEELARLKRSTINRRYRKRVQDLTTWVSGRVRS
jgi:hypothetical protein